MEEWKESNQYTKRLEELKEQVLALWTGAGNCGKLEAVEQERKEVMRKLEIIKSYENAIYQQYDDRWTTTLRDPATGKRKKIRKQSREEVLEEVVKILGTEAAEKEKEPEVHTIATLYPLWLAEKIGFGQVQTAARYDADWHKYLAGGALAEMKINGLLTSSVKRELVSLITERELTKRKYRDLKIIINGVLNYAVEHDLIPVNPALGVKSINPALFAAPEEETEQVFEEEEARKLIAACYALDRETGNPAYLAIILNFLLGLRAGELVALKATDFNFASHTLRVARSEVQGHEVTENGIKCNKRIVREGLKAGHQYREVIIDDGPTEQIVRQIVAEYPGEWLLTKKTGKRLIEPEYHKALRKANERAGITHRSSHKIRKTVISKMIESGEFSETAIRERAGHRDWATTQKYYAFCFRKNLDQASEKIGEVLTVEPQPDA